MIVLGSSADLLPAVTAAVYHPIEECMKLFEASRCLLVDIFVVARATATVAVGKITVTPTGVHRSDSIEDASVLVLTRFAL